MESGGKSYGAELSPADEKPQAAPMGVWATIGLCFLIALVSLAVAIGGIYLLWNVVARWITYYVD